MIDDCRTIYTCFAAATWSPTYWGEFDLIVDAAGEVTVETYISGSWYEVCHIGGASPDFVRNVMLHGSRSRIVGVAANSSLKYFGHVFSAALVGL